jgi:hypothetical protein
MSLQRHISKAAKRQSELDSYSFYSKEDKRVITPAGSGPGRIPISGYRNSPDGSTVLTQKAPGIGLCQRWLIPVPTWPCVLGTGMMYLR